MDVPSALSRLIGKRGVISKPSLLDAYRTDRSYISGPRPVAVALPRNTKQVSRILRFCNDNRIGVVARAGGSSLTGASVPVKGCIVIDFSRMNRILEVSVQDGYAVAEPGVVLASLNKRLSKLGYFYPPDPASAGFAEIGGTLGTNAGGMRALMYGPTRLWVLGLEAVLPDGSIIRTGGGVIKRSLGYDLTNLIVGSEGTLALVTKAVLRIIPAPEAIGRAIAFYGRIEGVVAAMARLKGHGIMPIEAEFMGSKALSLIGSIGGSEHPRGAKYALLVDIASTKESMARRLREAEKMLKTNSLEVRLATDKDELERRELYTLSVERAKRDGMSVVITDVIVPPSRLAEALKSIEAEAKMSGLYTVLFGHIGDGNIHANIAVDIKKDLAAVEALQKRFGRIALLSGGSVSAEHGVGLQKKRLLIEELSATGSTEELKLMRGIKRIFDPNGILNRGKIFD